MDKTRYSLFAQRLRQLRKNAGLKRESVAECMQIHRTTYTKYENDDAAPDQAGLLRLAALFSVTVDYLLGRDDVPHEAVLQDNQPVLQLDAQEQQLLVVFRKLTEEQRQKTLKDMIRQQREHQ